MTFGSLLLKGPTSSQTNIDYRFVNGLVDASQISGRLQSVSTVAESLNIPLWIVDLRHAATHEHLPSLSLLKSAAQLVCIFCLEPSLHMVANVIMYQAMRWLDDHYWSRQQWQQASDDSAEQQIADTLRQYWSSMMSSISAS